MKWYYFVFELLYLSNATNKIWLHFDLCLNEHSQQQQQKIKGQTSVPLITEIILRYKIMAAQPTTF